MIAIFAGFWRRGAAFVIDGIVLWIPNVLLGMVLPASTATTFFVAVVVGLPYYAGMHASRSQATLGKLAFGIKVTDDAGKRLGIGLAAARYFATWLSAVIFGIGFLMAAFTGRKRALHDIVCKTLVVNREAQPEDLVPGNREVMAVTWPVWTVVLLLFVVPLLGAVATAIALPVYQDYTTRARLVEDMARIEAVKAEVNAAISARRSVQAGARPLESPLVQNVMVDPNGLITITLSPERLAGGKVFMQPSAVSSTRAEWRCWAEGVPVRFMPALCPE